MQVKKRTLWMLIISLGLILISGIFASMLQSNFYRVEVIDIREDFGDGVQYSALLYKPNTATEDAPAPAIVLTHGYLNNRELQAQNAVELSRRGFVVLVVDRLGHGHSALPSGVTNSLTGNGEGLINAVEWLYERDYVDQDKIGISGHSMGGYDTMMTLLHYAQQEIAEGPEANKVAAGLIQAWSSFVMAPSTTHVGNLGARYDEFFYKEAGEYAADNAELDPNDPSTTNNMQYEFLPKDWHMSPTGMNFIRSVYPGLTGDAIEIGGYYTANGLQDFSAENPADEPVRVYYQPNEIHPRNHWSRESAEYIAEFFYVTLGVPDGHDYIAESRQIWPVKEFFNFVGMVGFFMLLLPLTDVLLSTKTFSSLKNEPAEKTPKLEGWKRHLVYWGSGGIITLTAGFALRYFYLDKWGWGTRFFPLTQRFPQPTSNPVVVWAVAIGLLSIALFAIGHMLVGKKEDDQPMQVLEITQKNFGKTILLTFLIVGGLYLTLFIIHGIFKTDFRIWTFNIRTFENIKFMTIIRYTALLGLFFIMNAFINANSRFENKPEWFTTTMAALFNVFGLVIVMLIQYITFFQTGAPWQWDMGLGYIVMFPIVPILILAAIFARQLYLRTGNIWLSGFVNALLFTTIMVANTAANFNYILF